LESESGPQAHNAYTVTQVEQREVVTGCEDADSVFTVCFDDGLWEIQVVSQVVKGPVVLLLSRECWLRKGSAQQNGSGDAQNFFHGGPSFQVWG
jgi:hypothetical protein